MTATLAPAGDRTVPTAAPRSLDRSGAGLLSFAHFCTDFSQGAVPALLPVVVVSLGLSYAVAATLVLAVAASSSVLQPLFGLAADKRSALWLAPLGVGLAGLGIGFAGFTTTYWGLVAALVVCGLGVAAFHPEAMRMATWVAGDRRATGMSIFSVGGTAGFAAAPLAAAAAMAHFGQRGIALLAVPAFIATVMSYRRLGYIETFRPETHGAAMRRTAAGADRWGAFAWLTGAIGMRSMAVSGITAFLPLFFARELGTGPRASALALTLFTGSGVFGSLAGGAIADRIGRWRLVTYALLASTVTLVPLALAHSAPAAYAALVIAGLVLYAPFSAMTVMGQSYLPSRVGTASGVTVGLAVTVGGLVAPVLGYIADHYGLRTMLWLLVAVPAAASLLLLPLPRDHAHVALHGTA